VSGQGDEQRPPGAPLRILFFGSPEIAVPSLTALASRHQVVAVVTQPDRPSGRGKKLAPPAVKERALGLGLPVLQPTSLKGPEAVATLAAPQADLFVVVAYGRLLPPAVLALPPLGPWNVHASLLPRYRGAAPIQWAIIRGESQTGVCIMRMEAGLDTGPVAARAETPITDQDTAGSLGTRLGELGARLLLETLPRIAAGTAALEPQDHARATLAPILRKEDGVLRFSAPAREVSAHARGVDPWPGPTAYLDGEPLKLFSPHVVPGEGEPGEVLGLTAGGLAVACTPGSGAVAFAELQLPGRRRLAAGAVLAGRPIPAGTRLRSDIVGPR
jgi:methionyl-tRNA formyltransferase